MTKAVNQLVNFFVPEHYDLTLDIDRTKRSFHGKVAIKGRQVADTILLHAHDLEIQSGLIISQGGGSVECEVIKRDNDEIELRPTKPISNKFDIVTLQLEFSGNIQDGSMHGLYPCRYELDGESRELLATQFESHHAREVFPCVDEPAAKATFDVTLTTETGVTVLGNMPVKNQHKEAGTLVTTFDRTPRMSSYLLAWVIGDLQRKTAKTNSGVEVNVWATPAQSPESLDFALGEAVQLIEFFDDYFETPYPLPKSDHVALPDFSSGAMENWGLITYREIALLADPATTTVQNKQQVSQVIAHELSHQWFGNLVTMRWWDNLWLNESFAKLMEYYAVDVLHPTWGTWLEFATFETIIALRRDAIDGVQPVQVGVRHPDEIGALFDPAIVYAKGARLMRMCQEFIGHEAFRTGLTSYFQEFAYQNTEADDLWRHLSKASGQDIERLMGTWIGQGGYPVVHVYPDHLVQERFFIGPHTDSNQVWPIPLGTAPETNLPDLFDARELWLSVPGDTRLNVRDSSHFITHYQPEHLAKLLDRLDTLDELGRLQLLHEQTLLARGGAVLSAELVDLLTTYQDETSQSVWDIMSVAFGELKKFVESDEAGEIALRQLAVRLARPLHEKLGWEVVQGEPESDTKLRALIIGMMIYGEASEALTHADALFVKGIEAIDPEVRSLVISAVVRRTDDAAVIEQLLEIYRKTTSADLRDDICNGITSVRTPKLIKILLAVLTDTATIRPQDLAHWFVYLIRNRYARRDTWQWMVTNWDWIQQMFSGDKSYDCFPRYAASSIITAEDLEGYKQFFEPKRNDLALARTIDLGIREIEGRVELVQRDRAAVLAKLTSIILD